MIKIKKKMSVKAQLKNTSFSIIVIPAGNILKTLWSKITAIQFKLNSKLEFKFLAILKSVLLTKTNWYILYHSLHWNAVEIQTFNF